MNDIITLINTTNILLIFIILIVILRNKQNKRDDTLIAINESNTKMFMNELDKMILYQTVYHVDSTFGKNFSDKKSVTADIENEDIANAVEDIQSKVNEQMSTVMKQYLYTVFGQKWIYDYINIQTLSLSLNYTRLNINKLTSGMFK